MDEHDHPSEQTDDLPGGSYFPPSNTDSTPTENSSGPVDSSRPFGRDSAINEPIDQFDTDAETLETVQPIEAYETMNPWLDIVIRPGETVSYVLKMGHWDNWILVSTFVYFLSIPSLLIGFYMNPDPGAAASSLIAPMGIPLPAILAVGLTFVLVIGYPMSLLFTWFSAWVYGIVGLLIGGIGTTAQVRIAVAWANVFYAYIQIAVSAFLLMWAVNRQAKGGTPSMSELEDIALISVISFPLYLFSFIVYCKAIGAAHRFSAWRGFATINIVSFGVFFGVIFMVIMLVSLANGSGG